MLRKFAWLSLFALAVVATLSFVRVASAAIAPDLEIGKAAPSFSLEGSDGKTHTLADYKGKVVVVHFQSCECPWDRAYQPIISGIATKFAKGGEGKKDVVFIGINSNKSETMAQVKEAIAKEKIPYVILKDPGNKVADAYAGKATPHMFVIDGEGVLRYRGGIEKAGKGPADAGKSEEQWLGPALEAIVAGKAPKEAVTQARGCTIKRE